MLNFGELRARVHRAKETQKCISLQLLKEAFETDPVEYKRSWVPYLNSFLEVLIPLHMPLPLYWSRKVKKRWEERFEYLPLPIYWLSTRDKYDALAFWENSPYSLYIRDFTSRHSSYTTTECTKLCKCVEKSNVRNLQLLNDFEKEEHVKPLLESSLLGKLNILNLGGNPLGPKSIQTLVENPDARHIKQLALSGTKFDDACATLLIHMAGTWELETLSVSNTGLTASGIALLQEHFPQVTILHTCK